MKANAGKLGLILLVFATAGWLKAQDTNPVSDAGQQSSMVPSPGQTYDNTPLYKVQVVGREIPAINYMHKTSSTTVGFEGTSVLPEARGEARVRAEKGRTVIDANFEHLAPANSFGPEYLTYVLWAITPEGRPVNLGEVLPTGKKDTDHITVTTDLQAFGLVVTAEPYYAVTIPSDLVVAQNFVVNGKTNGIIESVNAHYSLLPRGAYEETAGRKEVLHPIKAGQRSPLELYEAQNAVAIAEAGGADQYASDSMTTAREALKNADDLDKHKGNSKQTITYAREAVQAAEDARLITIRKLRSADEAAAQQARADAQQRAAAAQQALQQQEEERNAAQQAAAQREAERNAAQQAAEAAQQQQQQAQQAAEQARQEKEQAEQAAERAHEQQQQAEQQTEAARQAQQQAEQNALRLAQEAEQAREHLREQLNQVLQTRETARGLIMSMSDVLFGFDKYELKPDARVKLAKISGILMAYPDLKVQVAGYTDNVGTPEYNQQLSQKRADNVHDFLVSQNVPASNVTAQGHGQNDPVADNSSSSGRAENRRVELVVTGQSIGISSESSIPNAAPGGMSGARPQ